MAKQYFPMQTLILIIFVVVLSGCSPNMPSQIQSDKYFGGILTDKNSNLAVPNATVKISITDQLPVSRNADTNGVFKFDIQTDFPYLKPGDIVRAQLRVDKPGYEVFEKNITISFDNPKTDEEVFLSPIKPPEPTTTPPGLINREFPEQPSKLFLSEGGAIERPKESLTSANIRQAIKIGSWYLDHRIRRVRISQNGKMLAAGLYRPKISPHGLVYLWTIDEAERPQLIAKEAGGVDGLDFSTDGNYLGWSSWAYEVGAYDTGNRLNIFGASGKSSSNSLAFIPNQYAMAVGFENWVELFHIDSKSDNRSLLNGVGAVSGITFSDDGKYISVASYTSDLITMMELSTGKMREFDLGAGARGVSFSHSAKYIAAGGKEGVIKIWDRKTGEIILSHEAGDDIGEVAFSFDESMLAVSTRAGEILFFDIQQKSFIFALRESHPINSIQFSADGALLISGTEDGKVSIWAIEP